MGRGKSKGTQKMKTYALFHGSPSTDIQQFDMSKAGQNTNSGEHFLFFTDSKQMADDFSYERLATDSMFFNQKGKKGRVYEVDVTMDKPLDLTNLSKQDVKNVIKLSGGELTEDSVKRFSKGNNQLLKAYLDLNKISDFGYDGFIAKMDKSGAKEYAILDPKKAKIKR